METPEPCSLAHLAAESGTAVPCAGNLPVETDDPRFVWFVEAGAVDLFMVERRNGVQQSTPCHLLRADAGRLLPGVASQHEDTTLGLVAKGLPGTVLRRLPADGLTATRDAELAAHVDAWLRDVSAFLSRDVAPLPRLDMTIEPGQAPTAGTGTLSARQGVAWVSALPPNVALFMDLIDPAGSKGDDANPIPLTAGSWLTLMEPARLSTRSSQALAEEHLLLPALANFHAVVFSLERLNRRLAVVDQANLDRARATNRRVDEESARRRLFDLYGLSEPEDAGSNGSALPEALRIVGRHEGIAFNLPAATDATGAAPPLADILAASGVRGRRVRLAGEDKWWTGDSGAMLAFRADDDRPVALLPGSLGRYWEVDPDTGRRARVTAESAESLRADAWVFYRPLVTASAGPRDLFRLASKGLAADLGRYVATGLLGGLIALLPGVVLGFIAAQVIPDGETGPLYSVTGILAAAALIGALLYVLRGMVLMRLEGRVASRIEAAFWDRLLRLPLSFLHRYPAGDLALRGMTFRNLRDAEQGMATDALMSIVFLLPAFLLIFFYNVTLGVVTAAFGLLSLAVTVVLGLLQISHHGRVIQIVQRLAGRLFQLIKGISKLRVDGAEGSAFAVWARDYREQKHAELELRAREAHLQALGAALPFLAGAVLLAATLPDPETLAVGDFLVVYAVFMVFQTAVVRLGTSFSAVAGMTPALDQIRPFLAEPMDTEAGGESVGALGGEIVFDHVSFRYDPDGPSILDDVSIHARPGEFVAIAGESGGGKSTLFRLALGLEQPSAGAVYYDGRDLKHLNVKQVRRQIGVVPQEVRLHPEDLWDNIAGGHDETTAEDAWRAARLAAVDGEIAAMPMGMLTPVGASASVTSGGESQRITIAHALIRKPRILLLDEATNWLDNDSQARIVDNLAQLDSTRIVIAHRLSTLRQADRLYVLQSGRVVQEGTFEELAATEGVFRDLVRRQMA
ncbi:MAG: ATP-binding cassette domain-containing protein [Deltaproteobacteria bacterium]|nr:ATP-binding cassette domain-containing protein [Deltaproteobacteria bacterium]